MLACLLAVGLPIDPRGGALQEHAHQMMPDVDLLDIASSGRPVRDASCRAVGALDGRALQLHTLAPLRVAVMLQAALPDRQSSSDCWCPEWLPGGGGGGCEEKGRRVCRRSESESI